MRAAFPFGIPADQRVNKPGTPYNLQALQRTKLRDDFSIKQANGLECIYLSMTERFQLDCFIGHYIKTRNLSSVADIDRTLRAALDEYPGHAPVMVNELNAWIDRTLGHRASHPDFPTLDDL
jgi:hypothetical protein